MTTVGQDITTETANRARSINGLHLPINRRSGVRQCRACRDDGTCPDADWASVILDLFAAQHAASIAGAPR